MTLREYIEKLKVVLSKVKEPCNSVVIPYHGYCDKYLDFDGSEPFGRCGGCPIADAKNLPFTSACQGLWAKSNVFELKDYGKKSIRIVKVNKKNNKTISSYLKSYIKNLEALLPKNKEDMLDKDTKVIIEIVDDAIELKKEKIKKLQLSIRDLENKKEGIIRKKNFGKKSRKEQIVEYKIGACSDSPDGLWD